MFISLDGIDGCGKSTQVERLAGWLRQQGRGVVTCRDPGSTPLGEAVRKILLDRHDLAIRRRSEMLLYMAVRAQLVEEVIRPALDAGKVVVSDRYLLANVVYQGYAGGLDVATLWQIGGVATAGLTPRSDHCARSTVGRGGRPHASGVGPHGVARRVVSRPGACRLLDRGWAGAGADPRYRRGGVPGAGPRRRGCRRHGEVGSW